MTIWFWSDPHFGHDMTQPKFETDGHKLRHLPPDELDELIVQRHNERVRPGDHSYCLGDFAFEKDRAERIAARLNGKLRLLLGNHDELGTEFYRRIGFQKILAYRRFEDLIFSHIPLAPWSVPAKCRANVHGHCHRSKPMFYDVPNPDHKGFIRPVRYVNISVEHTDYRPVSLEQIRSWLP